jgi:hypothetical protein
LERVRWLVEIWKAMQKVLRPFWMGRLSNEWKENMEKGNTILKITLQELEVIQQMKKEKEII